MKSSGPLAGVRVVEFEALGPVRHACMLLADMGADVTTIASTVNASEIAKDMVRRGRRIVTADLKDVANKQSVIELVGRSDILVEGYRPQVMERLGLGPERFAEAHPGLIYARLTGWGQQGPLARQAGHDINFIATAGALHAVGRAGSVWAIPSNVLGDYAAGSLYLVCGVLAALHERARSGRGQTIDAAIFDGLLSLMSPQLSMIRRGVASERPGVNLLDGGAPHYNVYETSDGRHLTVGALEPKFLKRFCELVGLPPVVAEDARDPAKWAGMKEQLRPIFRAKPFAAWCELFSGEDVCVSPVLTVTEALAHPQATDRHAAVLLDDETHIAPAPRFSRTQSRVRRSAIVTLAEALEQWRTPSELQAGRLAARATEN